MTYRGLAAWLALSVMTAPVLGQVPSPMKATPEMLATPTSRPAAGFQTDGLSAVFFEGMPWKGKRTEVFAWIGLPKLSPGEKAPGMVLVHGGGGTAFEAWVKLWTSRGYAAIAMDTCGAVPRGSYGKWQRHETGGPPAGHFDEALGPVENLWPYHAVADILRAHSLLRSLPQVDADRTGLTGISWGGFLTCIASGLDGRFRFAVPVYGCGFLGEDSAWKADLERMGPAGKRWLALWDPSHYLPQGAMPKLWVTGTNDFAYPLDSLQRSYRVAGGTSTLAIRLRMPHGHGGAGENPEEIHAFADAILKAGPPLPRLGKLEVRNDRVQATYESRGPVRKAELLWTPDLGKWPERKWESTEAQLDATTKIISAPLPPTARVYFLNLYDPQGRVVSTEHAMTP